MSEDKSTMTDAEALKAEPVLWKASRKHVFLMIPTTAILSALFTAACILIPFYYHTNDAIENQSKQNAFQDSQIEEISEKQQDIQLKIEEIQVVPQVTKTSLQNLEKTVEDINQTMKEIQRNQTEMYRLIIESRRN